MAFIYIYKYVIGKWSEAVRDVVMAQKKKKKFSFKKLVNPIVMTERHELINTWVPFFENALNIWIREWKICWWLELGFL